MKLKSFLWCMLSVLMASAVTVAFSSCDKEEEDRVSVSTTSVNFEKGGGVQQVSINSNTSWTVSGSTGWFTVSPMSGSGNGVITITANSNSSSARSGNLFIMAGNASQNISVTQNGKSITPTNEVNVRNNSTYTLPRFRFVFLNSRGETLSDIEKGTVYPGESVSANIPASATEYYMATLLSGNWYFSPNYDVSYRTLNLTTSEIGQWYRNSSSSIYPENR